MVFWHYPLPWPMTMVAAIAILALTALRLLVLFGPNAFAAFLVEAATR